MAIKAHIKLRSWFPRPHTTSFSGETVGCWWEFCHRDGVRRALGWCDSVPGTGRFSASTSYRTSPALDFQIWAQVTGARQVEKENTLLIFHKFCFSHVLKKMYLQYWNSIGHKSSLVGYQKIELSPHLIKNIPLAVNLWGQYKTIFQSSFSWG